jgi:hypothetical protein
MRNLRFNSGKEQDLRPKAGVGSGAIIGVAASKTSFAGRLLKNVGEAGKTRQKRPEKRSLRVVNEHF